MNINLKRTTRTPHSEEILIYNVDDRDENDAPVSIGKLDVHYMDDQSVGTLLIWQEFATGFNRAHGPDSSETMDALIDAILTEISEPIGVSGEYGIEVYFPSVQNYQFISNYADDGPAGDRSDDEHDAALEDFEQPSNSPEEDLDDFTRTLRSRT